MHDLDALMASLTGYSKLLEPWAASVANYMLADVNRRDAQLWANHSKDMGRAIRVELAQAPTGLIYQQLMAEQVNLIKSIPLTEAQRVHDWVTLGRTDSTRASEVVKAILNSNHVTTAKAKLIARTEVARSASNFTQARARFAGSQGYIWRTSTDADVRSTHRKMEGKYVPWADPPKTDANLAPYHAGCGPNCRCFPEPILPDL